MRQEDQEFKGSLGYIARSPRPISSKVNVMNGKMVEEHFLIKRDMTESNMQLTEGLFTLLSGTCSQARTGISR